MKNLEALQTEKNYLEGMDWLSKQDARNALLCFEKAVRANADHYIAWNNIGVLLFHAAYHPEAEKAFKRALQIEPSYIDAYINIFDLFKSKSQVTEARDILSRLKDVDPSNAQLAKMEASLQTK